MRRFASFLAFMSGAKALVTTAPITPGDLITPDNASLVSDLVSPGNFILVKQGMRMNIAPTERLEWPAPYREATDKYSSQVSLAPDGTLKNYLAGQPFPLLDPNDPEIARKVIWNFSFRPGFNRRFRSSRRRSRQLPGGIELRGARRAHRHRALRAAPPECPPLLKRRRMVDMLFDAPV